MISNPDPRIADALQMFATTHRVLQETLPAEVYQDFGETRVEFRQGGMGVFLEVILRPSNPRVVLTRVLFRPTSNPGTVQVVKTSPCMEIHYMEDLLKAIPEVKGWLRSDIKAWFK